MTRFRAILVPAALFVFAGTAHAQRWGGSPVAGSHSSPAASRQVAPATGGSLNGTVSKWGGSPVQQHSVVRPRVAYAGQGYGYAYIPVAVAAQPALTYAADTTCPPAAVDETQPVEMQVVTSPHEQRQLTTIEVYRLQPRFQKP